MSFFSSFVVTPMTSVAIDSLQALLTLPAPPPRPRPPAAPLPVAILTHGASGDATSGRLPLLASLLADRGIACLRVTARSSSVAARAAALARAAEYAAAEMGAERIALGGHSMGARAACLAAAGMMARAKARAKAKEARPPARLAAVFLSSFPLHAPGKGATGPFRDEVLLDLFRSGAEREQEEREGREEAQQRRQQRRQQQQQKPEEEDENGDDNDDAGRRRRRRCRRQGHPRRLLLGGALAAASLGNRLPLPFLPLVALSFLLPSSSAPRRGRRRGRGSRPEVSCCKWR